ncbi:porin [Glaciimonas sp. PCH181]|uniref:porin n=1 Tax=Glaciimonas sp. PCH181 TaxID=2133943 RepID=UPI000D3873F8|nr:porin [Glaciimonas sp. PCH181]PUA19341.1 porin [Glaciimonas sp. PCH181]
MTKRILGIAALSLMAPLSHAQTSVTLYGIIDEGANYQSNAGGKTLYNLTSGVLSGSRWGLKGSEDLGGGNRALFVLESGFDAGTGALGQGARLFGRQSYIGLASDKYGTLMLGRQYDSVVTSIGLFEVGDQWGGYITAHPGDLDNFNNTVRTNNAIKYQSNTYNDVSFSGMYSLGGQAGNATGNQVWSLGTNYARGPLSLAAAYLTARTPNAGFFGNSSASAVTSASVSLASPVTTGFISAHSYSVAAAAGSYAIGRATLGATYSYTRYSDLGDLSAGANPHGYSGTATFNNVELNAKYQLTPALLIGAAYDYTSGGSVATSTGEKPDAKYHQVSIGTDYFLSKSTDIYLVGVYQKASGVDSRDVAAVAAVNNLTPSNSNHMATARLGLRYKF